MVLPIERERMPNGQPGYHLPRGILGGPQSGAEHFNLHVTNLSNGLEYCNIHLYYCGIVQIPGNAMRRKPRVCHFWLLQMGMGRVYIEGSEEGQFESQTGSGRGDCLREGTDRNWENSDLLVMGLSCGRWFAQEIGSLLSTNSRIPRHLGAALGTEIGPRGTNPGILGLALAYLGRFGPHGDIKRTPCNSQAHDGKYY